MRFWGKPTALSAYAFLKTASDGHVTPSGELATATQLVREELASDRFIAATHHHDTAVFALILAD
jgi:hypothetical protein